MPLRCAEIGVGDEIQSARKGISNCAWPATVAGNLIACVRILLTSVPLEWSDSSQLNAALSKARYSVKSLGELKGP
jgi:hypothetical protein